MIGWALCFELNFCIILYPTLFFFFHNKGGRRGCHRLAHTVWYHEFNLFHRISPF